MKYFITGGAGFIGSSIVDRLLQDENNTVVAFDNLSTGFMEFLESAQCSPRFQLIRGDILELDKLSAAMKDVDFIFHFAANADVRHGLEHPRKDLEQNTIGTFNVLEAMRRNGIDKIAFSSTGSVYGEAQVIPTPEDAPFPVQTSLYAASKLAGEGLIQAFCEGFGFQSWIFRFVSILGERYTHGHVFDFYKRLLENPQELYVLGDGHQKKSYLYIQDCIDAMLTAIERSEAKVNILNLGTDAYCEVNDSIRWISKHLGLTPHLTYAGGARGWIGDNPYIFLDTTRIQSLGWRPKVSIEEAVNKTVAYLQENRWVLKR